LKYRLTEFGSDIVCGLVRFFLILIIFGPIGYCLIGPVMFGFKPDLDLMGKFVLFDEILFISCLIFVIIFLIKIVREN
jgi:hypothetical protein